MNQERVLQDLFGGTFKAHVQQADYFQGTARVGQQPVMVIGTANKAEVGADMALAMARVVLDVVAEGQGLPIVFVLDTQGQRLRRRDELMGLNAYMAHLAKAVELARQNGHIILSVVYGEAVSGGYISTGMMADACYALAQAEIKVMNLPAMSRITKIPLERLETLAEQSPVFSPGVNNYLRMGHLKDVWHNEPARHLQEALAELQTLSPEQRMRDLRIAQGKERGGRIAAAEVMAKVLGHA
ncbi:biotin-independent malonate decarboxylase subunit gamma [Limnobacter sp.]|uniref:biotin-independent malonate decarboxylase subunit gamma n=1 Tax=Limnobacter sp. TaxID=2003368 RepID=UPI003511A83F